MSARPADVVIDDLANPRLPAAVTELMAAVGPMAQGLPFSPAGLMDQASSETGLSDFGDPRFLEPLGVLVAAYDSEAGLSPFGRVSVFSQLVQLLKNRLLITEVLTRHPEIHDVEIRRPIIIAGLPRTGTTHLHNLLAADPALRSLPYWESLEPVLSTSAQPLPGEPDPRLARTDDAVAFLDQALPYFKRMHEMTTWHVHEEIQLLAIDFSTMLFETMAPMPSYRDWYKAHDQTPSYAYLRTVLQVLQWARGGTRWVLKSPQHLEQFQPLIATFPDATVVVTHRDPVAVTLSTATMISYTARLHLESVDPRAIGRYWAARGEDLFGACVRDRDVLPAEQSIDVRFHDFMADEEKTVARVYERAGQPMTEAAGEAMAEFVTSHPRGRHGGVRYQPEAVGMDVAERRAALKFYVDRFGVEEEKITGGGG